MVEFLFLDLDDTILDFHKAERIALSKTLRQFGVEPTEEVLALYHKINLWHWEQLELGKLTRDQVKQDRFTALFRELGEPVDAAACAKTGCDCWTDLAGFPDTGINTMVFIH